MPDQTGGTAADSTAAPPAPPLPNRRPRVRQVSSRFMSPLIQSNSTPIHTSNASDLPRSKSAHRRQPSKLDENLVPETNRILDKSSAAVLATVQKQQRVKQHINGECKDHQHSDERVLSRPESPDTSIATGTDRVVSSRYKQVPNSIYSSNSLNRSSSTCSAVTAAARLLQEAISDEEKKLSRTSTSSSDDSDSRNSTTASNQGSSSCPNSPLCVPVNKQRSVPDSRCSMSDVDKWLAEKKFENSGKITSDCARSLNFSSSVKMGAGNSRPPHPPSCMRSGLDAKKGRKTSNHHEDVHTLKMLSNHYLQWQYVNAKVVVSNHAQKLEAERKLCSLGAKISDIRDNVKRKRSQLAVLRGIRTLTTTVEAQMPYLDEWSTLEGEYSSSLSGTTTALLNSSVRLPVSGEVRVDAGQLREALNSALKVVELIVSHIQRFVQKAEEMDISLADLARMVGGERALVQECGDLLSKNLSSQVRESSLRGTLMQLNYHKHHQPQKTQV